MAHLIVRSGLQAGFVILACLAITMAAGIHGGIAGMAFGYFGMALGMAFVFTGTREARDRLHDGTIAFWPALAIALAIAAIASACYVLGWEAYLAATHYRFIDSFAASTIAARKAAGASPAELALVTRQMAEFASQYRNPAVRMAMTLSEIAPVAVLAALLTAAIVRRPARA